MVLKQEALKIALPIALAAAIYLENHLKFRWFAMGI
jgi:ABC-type phosphate transport system permease subunit